MDDKSIETSTEDLDELLLKLDKNQQDDELKHPQSDDPDINNRPSVIQVVNPWTMKTNVDHIDVDKIKYEDKKNNIEAPSNINDLQYILADILAGDSKALHTKEYAALNIDKLYAAFNWLAEHGQLNSTTQNNMLTEAWRLNFRDKPPTPEEFLTPTYIGPMAETVFPHIKKTFIDSMDPLKPYRTTILYSCIGSGKSLVTVLINLFISVHFALMWHPYRYFGQSQTLDSKVYISKTQFKLMKDIKINDRILGSNGEMTTVIDIQDWENDDVYELEMDNGKKLKCGLNHLNYVSYRKNQLGNKIWENVTTKFIVENQDIEFEFSELEGCL